MPNLTTFQALLDAWPGMKAKWRTTQIGDRWKGDIKSGWPGGATPWHSSTADTEQEALDGAADHARSYWDATMIKNRSG